MSLHFCTVVIQLGFSFYKITAHYSVPACALRILRPGWLSIIPLSDFSEMKLFLSFQDLFMLFVSFCLDYCHFCILALARLL